MADRGSSGNVVVDQLQALQHEVAAIAELDQRVSHVRQAAVHLPLEKIIERQFVVSTEGVILARGPKDRSKRLQTYEGLKFIGEISSFRYMSFEEPSVESLIVNFVYPIITAGVDKSEMRKCHELTLKVPVLAITSCVERPSTVLPIEQFTNPV